jgi:hypothetical protein
MMSLSTVAKVLAVLGMLGILRVRRRAGPSGHAKLPGRAGADLGADHSRTRAGFLWKRLDPSDRWQHRLSLVGLIVAVLGFSAVFIQIGLTREQVKRASDSVAASTWATMSSQLLDLDHVMVDEPRAAEYFRGGKAPSSPKVRDKAWQLALMQLDLWDAWNGAERYVPEDLLDREAVDEWKSSLLQESSLLCRVFAESQDGYPDWYVWDGYRHCGSKWPKRLAPAPPPG